MFRFLAIKAIRFYQKTFSFDHGPMKGLYPNGYCRYYPSCSEYTAQSIEKNGFIVGCALGAYRILRCNPWSKGGYNPALQVVKKTKAKIKK